MMPTALVGSSAPATKAASANGQSPFPRCSHASAAHSTAAPAGKAVASGLTIVDRCRSEGLATTRTSAMTRFRRLTPSSSPARSVKYTPSSSHADPSNRPHVTRLSLGDRSIGEARSTRAIGPVMKK